MLSLNLEETQFKPRLPASETRALALGGWASADAWEELTTLRQVSRCIWQPWSLKLDQTSKRKHPHGSAWTWPAQSDCDLFPSQSTCYHLQVAFTAQGQACGSRLHGHPSDEKHSRCNTTVEPLFVFTRKGKKWITFQPKKKQVSEHTSQFKAKPNWEKSNILDFTKFLTHLTKSDFISLLVQQPSQPFLPHCLRPGFTSLPTPRFPLCGGTPTLQKQNSANVF